MSLFPPFLRVSFSVSGHLVDVAFETTWGRLAFSPWEVLISLVRTEVPVGLSSFPLEVVLAGPVIDSWMASWALAAHDVIKGHAVIDGVRDLS